jgi:hypothetical protein
MPGRAWRAKMCLYYILGGGSKRKQDLAPPKSDCVAYASKCKVEKI